MPLVAHSLATMWQAIIQKPRWSSGLNGYVSPGHWFTCPRGVHVVVSVPNTLYIDDWLSPPRHGRYLQECGGDRGRALAAYEWNIRVAHAILRDAGHFEIALRNAYDHINGVRWGGAARLIGCLVPRRRPGVPCGVPFEASGVTSVRRIVPRSRRPSAGTAAGPRLPL
jgi:hypothetical protein